MVDLFTFVKENDTNKPDLINELFDDNKIRNKQLDFMGDDEKFILKKREIEFYNKNLLKKIFEIVPFVHP
jgi:hypothetical protein